MRDLVESFQACVMDEVLRHRGDDAGLVAAFCNKVSAHHARYAQKTSDTAIRSQIGAIASAACERARQNGRIEIGIFGGGVS